MQASEAGLPSSPPARPALASPPARIASSTIAAVLISFADAAAAAASANATRAPAEGLLCLGRASGKARSRAHERREGPLRQGGLPRGVSPALVPRRVPRLVGVSTAVLRPRVPKTAKHPGSGYTWLFLTGTTGYYPGVRTLV